jgi:TPR repeat protein
MKSRPFLHPQRLVIAVTATIAMAISFIPLGRVPLFWTVGGLLLARKIALGVFAATVLLAILGRWGNAPRRLVRAVAIGACVLLIGFATFRIVVLAQRSIPTFAEDDPRAMPYYQRACDNGVMEGCTLLGACYWTGTCGAVQDAQRGLRLYEHACEGGDFSACGQLGLCFEVGGCGLTRSGERAVAMYERACSGGEMSMCNNLGICYFKGQCGVSKDDNRAAVLYQKACRGGDSGACHNLALVKN